MGHHHTNGTAPRPAAGTANTKDLTFGPVVDERDAALAERERREEMRRRQRLVAGLAAQLGERYSPSRAAFETYRIYHADQRPVVERLRVIAGTLDKSVTEGRGLILLGSVGSGKDHMAGALLYHAAREFGIESRWLNGRELFGASRDNISADRAEAELIRPLVAPSILCISDPVLATGQLSAWNVDLLFRVVDARYRLMRATWCTINARDADEAKSKLTPPIFDRLRDQAEIITCLWPSYRREGGER